MSLRPLGRLEPPGDGKAAPCLTVLLLAEDSADAGLIRKVLAEREGERFALERVADLAAALEHLERGGVDVVLADLSLPDTRELEVLDALRTRAPRVPVVVLTGCADEALAARAVRSGAQDYLVKGEVQAPLLARSLRYAVERHGFEATLADHHARLEALFDHALDAILLADDTGRHVDANPAASALTGFRREELLELRIEDLVADDQVPGSRELWGELLTRGEQRGELRLRRKDGATAHVEYRAVANILPGLHLSFLSDVSDRKRAEEELRHQAERLDLMVRQVPAALWTTGRDLRITSSLGAGLRTIDLDPDEIRGMALDELFGPEHESVFTAHRRALAGHHESYVVDFHGRRFHSHVEPFEEADGSIVGVIGIGLDVTERQEAEEALRTSEERYRRFFEEDLTGDCIVGVDGRIHACNPAFAQIFGFGSVQEALTSDVPSLVPEREVRRQVLRDFFYEGRLERYGFEAQKTTGEPVYLIANAVAAAGEDGKVREIRAYLFDDTERHLTEAQLRQSQKMEAVGRLAGGVAHDFNNLVTAISGYSDLLLARLAPDAPERVEIEEIRGAGERAAALTRQLLAFSRSQVLRPTVLDVNEVLGATGSMLHRLLGEDVRLVTRLTHDLAPVRADRGQLEQVLLNLAVNARDAMPRGGELLVETSEEELDDAFLKRNVVVHPGRYVTLTVTDSGEGMAPEVLERVFEPFFTTKEPGKGTGLGLSTVYGIVKQTGGYIFGYSEPDEGTTFKLYLPRAEAAAEPRTDERPEADDAGRGETVLVVEDEDAVRSLIGQILRIQGYDVIEAPNGRRALDACHDGHAIDLVVSDVVMPDVRGPDLEREIRKVIPEVPILFISGYPGEAIARRGELPEGTPFLQKPFTHDALTRIVRELLG